MKQPIKMTPGDDTHLSMLMAPCNLNFFVGKDREDLLAYGRAAFEAGKAGQCLHQIQEPEADIWPCVNIDVDASGKITNAKLYSPGLPAGNHDVYPVRVPYMDEHTEAWRACVDELEKAVPGFMSLGNMNGIECAVAAIRGLSERAKHQELAAAEQAAWHAGLDECRAQAAPAAVAVPHELIRAAKQALACMDGLQQHLGRAVCQVEADALRAALAATPAAAATVVLPEPWGYLVEGRIFIGRLLPQHVNSMVESEGFRPTKLFTQQQLSALLVTATGLPAQAVPAFCHVASLKLKSLQERGYQITGYALEKPVEGAQPERGFINHGGFVGWWWDGQSPQAQADAREFPAMEPELASLLGLMCFQCISFAQALRAGGYSIKKRAEDEQAAVLHWMLGHYFRSGPDGWRAAASADMERLRESAAKEGAQQG